jgi:hypothetical protein
MKMNNSKKILIGKTLEVLDRLPEHKAKEVALFAETLLHDWEETLMQKGFAQSLTETRSFDLMPHEEDIYATANLRF